MTRRRAPTPLAPPGRRAGTGGGHGPGDRPPPNPGQPVQPADGGAAMAPLIVLIVIMALARALGAAGLASAQSWRAAVALGLAAMFLLTASAESRPRGATA